jgi:hypothetical protein
MLFSSTAAHCCLLLRTAICAPTRFIHSYINMLNWLKSGKLSSGTSYDNVVTKEERDQERVRIWRQQTERIRK